MEELRDTITEVLMKTYAGTGDLEVADAVHCVDYFAKKCDSNLGVWKAGESMDCALTPTPPQCSPKPPG